MGTLVLITVWTPFVRVVFFLSPIVLVLVKNNPPVDRMVRLIALQERTGTLFISRVPPILCVAVLIRRSTRLSAIRAALGKFKIITFKELFISITLMLVLLKRWFAGQLQVAIRAIRCSPP